MPPKAYLFDLDMTLVDSSALDDWRTGKLWQHVRANMGQIKPFIFSSLSAHELPEKLIEMGHRVAIVTSSPRWYAEEIITQFGIRFHVLIAYSDTEEHKPDAEPLNKALGELGIEPSNAFHIGDSAIDVEASFHAGVTSIGAGWGVQNFESLSSAAPDILVIKPRSLLGKDHLERCGYFAEVLSEGNEPISHKGSVLPCGDNPIRYALGRYFMTEDPRHASSALSADILSLKNDDSTASHLGRALGEFLQHVDWTPDFIVPVPPKPGQARNRFEVLLEHTKRFRSRDTHVALDGLSCIKDIEGYKQMNSASRAAAVRGAYVSKYAWDKNRVLLVDDVLTTGGTMAECVRELIANGAIEVRVVALAKDQQVFTRKYCSVCGRRMRVRTQRSTGEKFWGCSGYPDCRHTEGL